MLNQEVFESFEARKKAELKAHRKAGGLVVYWARIERYESYGDDSIEWHGYFTTPEKAEAAIALEQAKLGPEHEWTTDAFGRSELRPVDQSCMWDATIDAVIVK